MLPSCADRGKLKATVFLWAPSLNSTCWRTSPVWGCFDGISVVLPALHQPRWSSLMFWRRCRISDEPSELLNSPRLRPLFKHLHALSLQARLLGYGGWEGPEVTSAYSSSSVAEIHSTRVFAGRKLWVLINNSTYYQLIEYDIIFGYMAVYKAS